MNISLINAKLKRMATVIMTAAGLVACSSAPDEPQTPPTAGQEPICMYAQPAAVSRAGSPLESTYENFGVWAWKTMPDASKQMVISRDATSQGSSAYYTRWTGTAWTYEYTTLTVTQYLRYWDRAASLYTFAAYAPYYKNGTEAHTSHTIGATDGGVSISGITAHAAPSDVTDWLVARWTRSNTTPVVDTDLISGKTAATPADLTDDVPLAFHHILSHVEFRIYLQDGSPAVTITNANIALGASQTIGTAGSYSEGAWTLAATSVASEFLTAEDVAVEVTSTAKADAVTLVHLVELPQAVEGKTVAVTLTLQSGKTLTGSFNFEEDWETEKHYIYYLRISGETEIILFDLDVEALDWEKGDDVTPDDLTNW